MAYKRLSLEGGGSLQLAEAGGYYLLLQLSDYVFLESRVLYGASTSSDDFTVEFDATPTGRATEE